MTSVIINDEFSDINNAKRHSQQQIYLKGHFEINI